MNVKETMELITYLKARRDKAAEVRNAYANEIEDNKKPELKDYYQKTLSESGNEKSLCDYFIRMLEQQEVSR